MSGPDRLWRAAYCFATVAANVYLSYLAARRYFQLKATTSYQQLYGDRLDGEMVAYFTLLGLHIVAIALFCLFSFVKSRNLANDGYRFGVANCCGSAWQNVQLQNVESLLSQLHERLQLETNPGTVKTLAEQAWSATKRSWQHYLPICSVMHIFSAYCLLLAQMVVRRTCISVELSKLGKSKCRC